MISLRRSPPVVCSLDSGSIQLYSHRNASLRPEPRIIAFPGPGQGFSGHGPQGCSGDARKTGEDDIISTPGGYWGADFSTLRFMMPGFADIRAGAMRADETWTQALVEGRYIMERWSCDLSTGLFTIGEKACARHALGPDAQGLLDLVRRYAKEDRQTILNVLEEATSTSSCFCYCTTLMLDDGTESRIFCVGSSEIVATSGWLHGVFAFPPLNG